MVDRLSELHLGGPPKNRAPPGSILSDDAAIGMEDLTALEEGRRAFMPEFFEQVEAVKRDIETIQAKILEVEEQFGLELGSTSQDETTRLSRGIAALSGQIDTLTKTVSARLQRMNEENKRVEREQPNGPENRVRASVHSAWTKKFVDTMKQYQDLQYDHKAKTRDRQERQVRIARPDATADEVAAIVDQAGDLAMMQRMVGGASHAAAKNALLDVQDRHRDILMLEQSITELHQLFVDMAVLVERQGELLDQIEYNVSSAVQYTDDAVGELAKANKIQKSNRKKMCCIIVCFLIIFIIIGSVLAGVLPSLKSA